MSLLFGSGFEDMSVGSYASGNAKLDYHFSNVGANNSIVAAAGRCNGRALFLGSGGNISRGVNPATPTSGWAVLAVKPQGPQNGNAWDLDLRLLTINDTTGSLFYLVASALTGGLYVVSNVNGSPVICASAGGFVRPDEWSFIGLEWTIAASTGTIKIKHNNSLIVDASGLDTDGAGYSQWVGITFGGPAFGNGCYMDDVAIGDTTGPIAALNTIPPDIRIGPQIPSAPGNYAEWTKVNAATNWQAVRDSADGVAQNPDGDATYNNTLTVGYKDSFKMSNVPQAAATILATMLNICARKTDAGLRTIAPLWRISGVDYIGSGLYPADSSYRYLTTIYETNPATAVAWTVAELDDATHTEAGYELES